MQKETYKVYFYFKKYAPNPFIKADKEVIVTVDSTLSDKEIINRALNQLNKYPRTYSTLIVKHNKEVITVKE